LGLLADRIGAIGPVRLECASGGIAAQGDRPSPRDSLRFEVGGRPALLCYGRPSARGRRVFGDLVPMGELWRLGANEPTVLHLPFRATVAGVRVGRGKVALYAVPEVDAWELVLNRSTRQWGLTRPERGRDGVLYPNAYTPVVARAELGRATLPMHAVPHVERLTAGAVEVDARRTDIRFEWETSRVVVPVEV
jgi:hypothetical protein